MFLVLKKRRPAFTLVELLVVIGIIALLISILLPALNKARKAASTIKCGANLHAIGQAMQIYAVQNKGYFPGPNTSGYFLMAQSTTYGDANCPDIGGLFDWQAPLATAMNIKLNRNATLNDRLDRFLTLLVHPAFLCPDNVGVLATSYPMAAVNIENAVVVSGKLKWAPGARQYISYTAAMNFMFVNSGVAQPGSLSPTRRTNGTTFYNPPPGYSPKVNKIGQASRKIYACDGGRYWQSNQLNMDMSATSTTGEAWADVGPYSASSNGMNRSCAPLNNGLGLDARVLWARHGSSKQRLAGDNYKFNAVFFDGHVALLGDLEGSNPNFWGPKGMTIDSIQTEVVGGPSGDVYNTFLNGMTGTYTIPE